MKWGKTRCITHPALAVDAPAERAADRGAHGAILVPALAVDVTQQDCSLAINAAVQLTLLLAWGGHARMHKVSNTFCC